MESTVGLIAALAGGFISFFAPCAAVLVPAFLLHLAGVNESGSQLPSGFRWPVLLHTLSFVLGFAVVFVLLGASLGLLSQAVRGYQVWLTRVGGGIVIFLGLFQLGLIPWNFMSRERGLRPLATRFKYISSMMVGSTFAIAWTPCVGPILGAILVLAGISASAGQGAALLSAYSAGLMIPFLATGLFMGWVGRFLNRYSGWLRHFQIVTGLLLIVLGIIVFTGRFTQLVGYLFFLGR